MNSEFILLANLVFEMRLLILTTVAANFILSLSNYEVEFHYNSNSLYNLFANHCSMAKYPNNNFFDNFSSFWDEELSLFALGLMSSSFFMLLSQYFVC